MDIINKKIVNKKIRKYALILLVGILVLSTFSASSKVLGQDSDEWQESYKSKDSDEWRESDDELDLQKKALKQESSKAVINRTRPPRAPVIDNSKQERDPKEDPNKIKFANSKKLDGSRFITSKKVKRAKFIQPPSQPVNTTLQIGPRATVEKTPSITLVNPGIKN